MTAHQISCIANRIVDFGPPLVYRAICPAYTVEKMTLFQHLEENSLEFIVLRTDNMPRARMEGTLYSLTDEEVHDLDKRRGIGVQCERKRIPVYIPYSGDNGERAQIYAYVYIGLKQFWLQKIEYSTQIARNKEYSLVSRVPDADTLLNNRFRFLPEPINFQTPIYTNAVVNAVRTKNQKEATRLRWQRFKQRFQSFLNDE